MCNKLLWSTYCPALSRYFQVVVTNCLGLRSALRPARLGTRLHPVVVSLPDSTVVDSLRTRLASAKSPQLQGARLLVRERKCGSRVRQSMSAKKQQQEVLRYNDRDPYGHPRIPFRGYYDAERCKLRREWAERFTSSSLKHTGQWWSGEGSDDSCSCLKLKGNIENPIGLAKVPIGLAGPLLLSGEHVNGYVLCPFATTEGALIASATRGATALTRAGGVRVRVTNQCMLRGPAFQLRNSGEVERFWQWMLSNFDALKKQVKLFSQHANLVELTPVRFGRVLVVQFRFTTEDAAGQNMVTSGTWHACKWLLRKVDEELPRVRVTEFWVESNLSGDKKMTPMNLYQNRGIHAQAEAWIPEAVLRSVLKVS